MAFEFQTLRLLVPQRFLQDLHRLRIAFIDRYAQRPIAQCMHIGTGGEQRLHRLCTAALGRIDQTVVQFRLLLWRKVFRLSAKKSHDILIMAWVAPGAR